MVLLLIILLILCIGGLPAWEIHPYGYGPSGAFGFVLVVLIVLLLFGRI